MKSEPVGGGAGRAKYMHNMRCVPAKFQRGDKVVTPRGIGRITAVGIQHSWLVYRVGRNCYWHGWQLRRTA